MLFTSLVRLLRVSGINLLIKLLSFLILFYIEAQLFAGLHLTTPAVAAIAISLTVVGTIADVVVVPPLGNLPALTLGFLGMTFIVWFVASFYPETQVTLVNAMLMSLPLGPIEYSLHRYVLDSLARQRHHNMKR
jgi:hypothetical protein